MAVYGDDGGGLTVQRDGKQHETEQVEHDARPRDARHHPGHPVGGPHTTFLSTRLTTAVEKTHTHTHSVLTAIFPGEPGLAGCPLNSSYPFIPGLRILLGQA